MSKFICSSCGNIGKKFDENMEIIEKCSCGKQLEVEELYPWFDAINFISTSRELYDNCKSIDKQNKSCVCNTLNQLYNIDITIDDLTNYIVIYESFLARYEDSNPQTHLMAEDEFEEYILKKYKYGIQVRELLTVYWRNRMRKPFVIMVSSAIEMLFNDFFKLVIVNKLGKPGANIMLDKYKYSGIQECINICDAFINIPVKEQMEIIKPGFYDKWTTLRSDRNAIVHSNSKYITMHRANDINKLLSESEEVFSMLKSNIYKENR